MALDHGDGYDTVDTESLHNETLYEGRRGTSKYHPRWQLTHWNWRSILWRFLRYSLFLGLFIALVALGHWIYVTVFLSGHGYSSRTEMAHPVYSSDIVHQQIESMKSGQRLSCNCGESISEARAHGCKYDSISVAWLPPYCRDDELAEEFNRAGPGKDGEWDYYADQNGTQRLSLEQVSMLADVGGLFYMSQLWHIRHCHFVWRQQFRSRWTKISVSLRDDNEKHIMHCMDIAEKRDRLDRISTGAGVALHADISSSH